MMVRGHVGDSLRYGAAVFGKGGGGSNTVQKSDPWIGQQTPLLHGYGTAQDLLTGYQTGQNEQYYPNSTYVPLNEGENTALNSAYKSGLNGTSQFNAALGSNQAISQAGTSNPGSQMLANTANGDYLNAGNPYFQKMAGTVAGQVLPQITSQFGGGDRLDSGLATSAASQGLGNAIGNLAYQNYSTERGLQQQAQNMIGTNYTNDVANQVRNQSMGVGLNQQYMSNLNTALMAEKDVQGDSQNNLNADISRWNYNQHEPWQVLNQFTNAIQGNPGGTVQTSGPGGSGVAGAISGVAGLASAANSAYGLGTAAGLWGGSAAAGGYTAAGGALFGDTLLAADAAGGAAVGGDAAAGLALAAL